MTTNEELIEGTVALIAQYSPACAEAFRTQPFRRLLLARAFCRGFVKNAEDDIHPDGELVLRVAMMDKDHREELTNLN